MRHLRLLSLASVLLSLFLLSSCGDDDPPTTPNGKDTTNTQDTTHVQDTTHTQDTTGNGGIDTTGAGSGEVYTIPGDTSKIWIYEAHKVIDSNQMGTDVWYDTARVIGQFTFKGKSGILIRSGRFGEIATPGHSYDNRVFRSEGGKLYTIPYGDTASIKDWVLIADPNRSAWIVSDTTTPPGNQTFLDSTHSMCIGSQGGQVTMIVDGQSVLAREYRLTYHNTSYYHGVGTDTEFRLHFYLAPGVGLAGWRTEGPPVKASAYDQKLVSYRSR